MIVRLKVYLPDRPGEVPVEFQFYDSPIKRVSTVYQPARPRRRFNSMIVRLKGTGITSLPDNLTGFNSMIVRLKVPS